MPSKGELDLMYFNIGQGSGNNIGNFSNDVYISSTENDAYSAWGQNFSDGTQNAFDKNITLYLRPIRAF